MEPRSNIFFDPDEHPEDTLKAFEEFIKVFSLRYEAQYPDPPKVSLESAIQRWKVVNTTEQNKTEKQNRKTEQNRNKKTKNERKEMRFLCPTFFTPLSLCGVVSIEIR